MPEATLSNALLRMNEGDAAWVFHRDNTVATTLHRPGDAWLNEAGGCKDANQRVQIAWLDPDQRRRRIAALAARGGGPGQRHIFTGLGHADLTDSPLAAELRRPPTGPRARHADALLARPAFIASELLRQSTPASQVQLVNLLSPDAPEVDYLHCLHERLRQSIDRVS